MAMHLISEERDIINILRAAGKSYAAIGKYLGRAASTIYDEVKRNQMESGCYFPEIAQEKADRRAKKARVKPKMQDPFIHGYVTEHLSQKWSPEQIAGRLKIEHQDDRQRRISPETIYKWAWENKKLGNDWHKHLRSGLKKKRRGRRKTETRGRMVGRVDIDERPASVDTRRFLGDWEGDTVVGKRGKNCIASWVERKTRYVCFALVNGVSAPMLSKAIRERFAKSPQLPIRTLTLDNGREFRGHAELSGAWNCKTYFAKPHHPWERGLNENTNGLLRQFYPKGTDFSGLTQDELAKTEYLLNTRPRKCLQYRTPQEVMEKLLLRRDAGRRSD